MAYRSLTKLAHETLQMQVRPGGIAVDATAGNGNDTEFLVRCVGSRGMVYAIDIQQAALQATRARLEAAGLIVPEQDQLRSSLAEEKPQPTVEFCCGDHSQLDQLIAAEHRGSVAAVTFNLGYLPGGDKRVRTVAERTLAAMRAAVNVLVPGGALSLIAYRGHEGGAEECAAVDAELKRTVDRLEMLEVVPANDSLDSPVWFFCRRR